MLCIHLAPRHRLVSFAEKPRRGSVLVVVLVVVMLLALGAYTFTQVMLAELEATVLFEREVRARAYADSGIELVAAVLGERTDALSRPNVYDNPALFHLAMDDAPAARGRGYFSIVAPRALDAGANAVRFGLIDESSKLNLNTLLSRNSFGEDQEVELLAAGGDTQEVAQQETLMSLPGMTVDVADAILDWLDTNETPRQSGAENEYYGTLNQPYQTKNGKLQSLDELLRVRGVTYSLLFGEDANRNGLLDANENDGEASLPFDNADGLLDRGWSAYLTVQSKEANLRADGEPRIDVNQDDLAALYDAVLAEFDEEKATFITAYRLNGPDEESDDGDGNGAGGGNGTGSGGQGGGSSGRRSGSSGRRSGSGGRRGGGGQSGSGGGEATPAGGGESEERGGLELSGGGSQQIDSLYNLVGATVTAEVNGKETKLESPWKDDSASIAADMPLLLDRLATTADEFIEGRISIAQAPREVLLTIPEIDEQVVQAIVGAQATGGAEAFEPGGSRSTTAWLLTEGIVDLEAMRVLDPFITARGDVYRVQSVGYFEAGGPAVRLEAVIDATQIPPRILSVRDLSELGRGFALQPTAGEGEGGR